MAHDCAIGVFAGERDIVAAARATRAAGFEIHDAFTPYAVHGLEEAMGMKPSRLPWICFGFASIGFVAALFIQHWIGAIDWPLNVGGKPFNSLPAYLPVMFELTVLSAGLGVVLALLWRARLYPGRRESLPRARVTDDRFALAVRMTGGFDAAALSAIWRNCGLLEQRQEALP